MQNLSTHSHSTSAWLRGWLLSWLPLALLSLGAAPAARAQCAFDVAVTPAGPLTLCAGGSTTLTAAALTSSFNAGGSGFNGEVRAILVQPDGKVLVGGFFTAYNGTTVPYYLARLNIDGSLDAAFNANNTGFNSPVNALAIEPDGQILVGGGFTNYNGQNVPHRLLRLNADGSRDVSFNGMGSGFSAFVTALAIEPDGQVLVGGDFTTYNGTDVPDRLVRLNTDGSLDVTFNSTGSGFGATVRALALEPSGQILVGGGFTGYNGQNVPDRVLRLNADGSWDTSFNSIGSGFDAFVTSLVLEPDGQVLVGGDFTTYNSADVPDRLVRLNTDGSLDASHCTLLF